MAITVVKEGIVAEKTDEIYCVPKKEGYTCKVYPRFPGEEVDVSKILIKGKHEISSASIHPKAISIRFTERPPSKIEGGILVVGMGEKYGVYWKGKLVERGFDTEAEAQTFINIKSTEMELGDYTPSELERFLKIKKVT